MKYCIKCNQEVTPVQYNETETYKVKGIDIQVSANVYHCPDCGNTIWDDEQDDNNLKKAFAKYREINNLLNSDQIKSIRNKYGLSQKSFSIILGFGEKTITRYENGSIQDMAQNNLILLMDNPHNFKRLWDLRKGMLSLSEKDQCEHKLNDPESYDVEETSHDNIMRIDFKPSQYKFPKYSEDFREEM